MNYQSYKNARDESLSFLIKNNIIELPVDFSPILKSMNIIVRKDYNLSPNERGYSVFEDNEFQIVVPDCPIEQKRYTIMHEVGHIVMKHIQNNPKYEYEAERFAIGVLAPACVLWGLNIHTAEEISKLCNISITAARIRAQRMELLYKREQEFLKTRGRSCFLQLPLEQQVYQQFKDFINKNRKQ